MPTFTSVPYQSEVKRALGGGRRSRKRRERMRKLWNTGKEKTQRFGRKAKTIARDTTKKGKEHFKAGLGKVKDKKGALSLVKGTGKFMAKQAVDSAMDAGTDYLLDSWLYGGKGGDSSDPAAQAQRAKAAQVVKAGMHYGAKRGARAAYNSPAVRKRLDKLYSYLERSKAARNRLMHGRPGYQGYHRSIDFRPFGTGARKGKKGKKGRGGKKGRKGKKGRSGTKRMNVAASRAQWRRARDIFDI